MLSTNLIKNYNYNTKVKKAPKSEQNLKWKGKKTTKKAPKNKIKNKQKQILHKLK